MPSQDDFRLLMTSDLASELDACCGNAAPGWSAVTKRPRCAGAVLLLAGRPAAAMGFAIESQRTLAITDPVFLQTVSILTRMQWTHRLLKVVSTEAEKSDCRIIRCLQPADGCDTSSWMQRVLAESGFLSLCNISSMERAVSEAGTPPIDASLAHQEVQLLPFETRVLAESEWSRDERSVQMLRYALGQILAESHDLRALTEPNADDLLGDWNRDGVIVVQALQGDKLAGVCSVVIDVEQTIDGSTGSAVQIQYIGVVPAFRRNGIATGIIGALPRLLSNVCSTELRRLRRMRVFCDTRNEPAQKLYARCGFDKCSELSVWCRLLGVT